MSFSPLIHQLIDALRCLPGVGPKSAQRMAFHLLERRQQQAEHLAKTLLQATARIGHCQSCNNFSENDYCQLCNNPKRDRTQLCIVESPADVLVIEQTAYYNGLYFVLMGHLSPIDGIGPEQLHINKLEDWLDHGEIQEVILATNPTIEGEATAHYLADLIKTHAIKVTRIAHGVPIGGELEFVDSGTLTHALAGRETIPN